MIPSEYCGEKREGSCSLRRIPPELHGKRMAVDGMKMTPAGESSRRRCFMGCLQAITGLCGQSIIAVILAMAFC